MTVQVVLGAKHDTWVSGEYGIKMKINGKRFADSCIDYGQPAIFANILLKAANYKVSGI